MYIIIAGGGVAGSTIASELVNKKHDVVVIDASRDACEEVYARTGAVTVCGRATDIGALGEAGIERADAVIGALYRGEDNLTFALLAKSFGVPNIIVKMRDPAYENAYNIAGVTAICDMINFLQNKVMNEIENHHIKMITPLEGGRAQLVMYQFPENWPEDGVEICELTTQSAFSRHCVLAGILKHDSEKIMIPFDDERVYGGDKIFMVVDNETLKTVAKQFEEVEKTLV